MAMSMATQSTSTSFPWWMLLLEGIAALIIGFFLVISPGITTVVLVQFLGFYWLFSGVLSLVSLFVDPSRWGWKLFGGILGILAGLVVIRNPLWSALLVPTILVITLAILALFQGVVKLVEGFSGGGFGAILLGILDIIVGIVLLGSPLVAALILPIVVGILAIVGGIVAIIMALRARSSGIPATVPPQSSTEQTS
jgi:uncharacterized membrane protein HdeD (DUF308 family)